MTARNNVLTILLISLIILTSLGSNLHSASNKKSPIDSIKSYKDIPGVTEEEIFAIEALKAERGKFTYGACLTTEAFILPDDSYAGFTKKFCNLLSELFGIEFVLELHEWDELMSGFKSGAIDFAGDLTPTAERMQVYGMTQPIAERLLGIFMHVNSNKIQVESDVNNLNIGFFEGTITADFIKKAYPVTFTAKDVPDYPMAAEMIKSGEIDAFIIEAVVAPAFAEYDFIRSDIFFPLVYTPVSKSTANPELYPVISVVNKYLDAGGIDKLHELYREGDFDYAKYKLHQSFTSEEKAYIDDLARRKAPVAVAFEDYNYPVSFYNEEEEKFEGVAVDVLAEISRLTDIEFKTAFKKDVVWAEIFDGVKSGNVSMFAELLYSKEREEYFIWSAMPYSHSYYAIISKADFPNLATYQVTRYTVGVVKKSAHKHIYHEMFPDNQNLKEYDSLKECLEALERGEIDLLMASEHALLTQANYREKTGYKINMKLDAKMDSYFGFYKDETVLRSIIDKAQQYVDTDVIEISWTGRTFDYTKKVLEYRARFFSIFAGIVTFLLFGAGLLVLKLLKLSKRLNNLASRDMLTEIYNRRHFLEQASVQMSRAMRLGKECFVIIYDLDHFKSINDTYGHSAGDKVLKETAQMVKEAIRPYDLFGRYGGEEFIILMCDTDKTDAINTTERIRQSMCETPVEFEDKKILVSASFGIAQAVPANGLETAIKYADEALYKAKESGRNRLVFYE